MTAGPVADVDLAPGRRTKTAARRPVDLPGRREGTSCVLLGALLGLPGRPRCRAGWSSSSDRTALWRLVPSATTAPAA